jgi:hypothetical protein
VTPSVLKCLKHLCRDVISCFVKEYIYRPTIDDLKRLLGCVWFDFWLWILFPKSQKPNQRVGSSKQFFFLKKKLTFSQCKTESIREPAFIGFSDGTVKTYIEELLIVFSGFDQTNFSFLTPHSSQQFFS